MALEQADSYVENYSVLNTEAISLGPFSAGCPVMQTDSQFHSEVTAASCAAHRCDRPATSCSRRGRR